MIDRTLLTDAERAYLDLVLAVPAGDWTAERDDDSSMAYEPIWEIVAGGRVIASTAEDSPRLAAFLVAAHNGALGLLAALCAERAASAELRAALADLAPNAQPVN